MDIGRIKSDELTIKSDITPETVTFYHYPDGEKQLHIHIIVGISGRSVYLRHEDAVAIKAFLNKHY